MTHFHQVFIFISGTYGHVLLGLSSLEFDSSPSVNKTLLLDDFGLYTLFETVMGQRDEESKVIYLNDLSFSHH